MLRVDEDKRGKKSPKTQPDRSSEDVEQNQTQKETVLFTLTLNIYLCIYFLFISKEVK